MSRVKYGDAVFAVDTNAIVLLLTQDERKQAASATAIFKDETVWIGKTVLLETAWVLKSSYGYKPEAVRKDVEDRPAIGGAWSLAAQGIDIADALHFKSRPHGARFVSFNESFVRKARRAGLADVESV
jgi:predicted nucleic acid-binding protein